MSTHLLEWVPTVDFKSVVNCYVFVAAVVVVWLVTRSARATR
jgi:hypothetical protein